MLSEYEAAHEKIQKENVYFCFILKMMFYLSVQILLQIWLHMFSSLQTCVLSGAALSASFMGFIMK